MKLFCLLDITNGPLSPSDETTPFSGITLFPGEMNGWTGAIVGGTSEQIAVVAALPVVLPVCDPANLNKAINEEARVGLNLWLMSGGVTYEIAEGVTNRNAIQGVFAALGVNVRVEMFDVIE